MTSTQRLLNCLAGDPVDRVPIFTQIPFALDQGRFVPGPFYGYEDADDWRVRDPAYQRLVQRMEADCDNFFIWRPPCMQPLQFLVPPSQITAEPPVMEGERITRVSRLNAGGRTLQTASAVQPGTGHAWVLKHLCSSADDARLLLKLDWDGHPPEPGDFFDLQEQLGDRGLMWVTVPSPVLVICRLFDPMEFLMLAHTDSELIHGLLETVSERIHANLTALLAAGVGPIIRFGGAEHCTPPLMGPDDFDAFVVRYDAPLMALAKAHGCRVAVHCHGGIRHALKRFLEMGVDQTDPVEQPPDGEISLAEARKLSEGRITLTGNLQMREMDAMRPAEIKVRVRKIIEETGPERLIVTTTGTPLEPISGRLEANYNAMIDAVLEYSI